ncbi:MAG: hypothetical protein ACYCUV_14875, partial [Phycisphaerae bacterium]
LHRQPPLYGWPSHLKKLTRMLHPCEFTGQYWVVTTVLGRDAAPQAPVLTHRNGAVAPIASFNRRFAGVIANPDKNGHTLGLWLDAGTVHNSPAGAQYRCAMDGARMDGCQNASH